MSLLVYNPIEAMAIIYSADLFTGRKKKWSDILHFCVFGALNFIIQYLNGVISSAGLFLIFDLLSMIALCVVFYLYYLKLFKRSIEVLFVFMLRVWWYNASIVFMLLFELYGVNIYDFIAESEINKTLIVLFLKLFTFGVVFMFKKIVEIISVGKEKAFTDRFIYQRKLPKLLKK